MDEFSIHLTLYCVALSNQVETNQENNRAKLILYLET